MAMNKSRIVSACQVACAAMTSASDVLWLAQLLPGLQGIKWSPYDEVGEYTSPDHVDREADFISACCTFVHSYAEFLPLAADPAILETLQINTSEVASIRGRLTCLSFFECGLVLAHQVCGCICPTLDSIEVELDRALRSPESADEYVTRRLGDPPSRCESLRTDPGADMIGLRLAVDFRVFEIDPPTIPIHLHMCIVKECQRTTGSIPPFALTLASALRAGSSLGQRMSGWKPERRRGVELFRQGLAPRQVAERLGMNGSEARSLKRYAKNLGLLDS